MTCVSQANIRPKGDLPMLNDRDINVVEQMCASGMSLEALYKIFKTFDKEDVKTVYDHYHSRHNDYVEEPVNISVNCS